MVLWSHQHQGVFRKELVGIVPSLTYIYLWWATYESKTLMFPGIVISSCEFATYGDSDRLLGILWLTNLLRPWLRVTRG